MKIAYLARIDTGKSSGVLKKITRQISNWEQAGNDTRLFALSKTENQVWEGLRDIDHQSWTAPGYPGLLKKSREAIRNIREWNPDIVYWRYGTSYPGMVRLMEEYKTIVEVNTHYSKEYWVINKLAYLIHRLFYKKAFRVVAGFCSLTQELSDWVSEFDKPTLILGDGIDIESISPLQPKAKKQPVLVCMATKPYPWIGVDKFLQLAERFPHWRFDMIGLSKNDIVRYRVPDNVFCHGFLSQEKYFKLMERADIAIGTLALHRIGLNQMAPLKLREYLAFGLPSVIAYEDTDFPHGAPFILQLPNSEKNLDENWAQIESFVNEWTGQRVNKEAVVHLSTQRKESVRLEFLKETMEIEKVSV